LKKLIETGQIPISWSAEELFLKAQRYVQRMGQKELSDQERALWSSLSLELLARASLSNVSAALLAEVKDKNWQSLFHALGFAPTAEKFSPKSISAIETYSRLSAIFPGFTKELETFCVGHTGRRNSELHSGEPAFDNILNSGWAPQFYLACESLLHTMGKSLEDFVGRAEAGVAKKLIEAAVDKSAKAVRGDVEAHKKVWSAKGDQDRASLVTTAALWATRPMGHRVSCPSCGSPALVFGEAIGSPHQKLSNDTITETQEFLPTHFECIACSLKILGLSRLSVVALGERFKRTLSYDAAEYYAPDDEYPEFEDDNNEPF